MGKQSLREQWIKNTCLCTLYEGIVHLGPEAIRKSFNVAIHGNPSPLHCYIWWVFCFHQKTTHFVRPVTFSSKEHLRLAYHCSVVKSLLASKRSEITFHKHSLLSSSAHQLLSQSPCSQTITDTSQSPSLALTLTIIHHYSVSIKTQSTLCLESMWHNVQRYQGHINS